MQVTEFGILKSVEHNENGWVIITSENGHVVTMKKIYPSWASVYLKAQKMIGRPIVYETGQAPAVDFFRDIYEDNPDKPMFTFPDDAGPAAQYQIIIARMSASRWKWNFEKADATADERAEEIERQKVALSLLEKQDFDEIKAATEALDEEWSTKFEGKRRQKLLLQGAANHGGKIQNLDRKFMLRLNYDISQMRQLPVEIIGRGNNNYVRVRLPSFDNIECELGLKKSTQRGTQGAWGVCTIKNEYGNLWFKLEEKHYPNAKTSKWTLKKMQEAHLDLMNLLVKEEQLKLDVAFDQVGDVQVISA